jgi:hypothetical protein
VTAWRKFYDEELHNLCSSLIIRVFKSRKTRETGHARDEKYHKILIGKPEENGPLERPDRKP